MTWAYYNEWDPYAAQWLRNLIKASHITDGEVDERDIREVSADDLKGFERVHFFAGIAGWDLALDIAGWEGPVWTGSCPCQPFSAAGQRKAGTDERHLWPAWFRLIRECRPDTTFGEQVEGAVGLGWLDRVFADLEDEGYACGAAVLGAHSVGAPHIRQRLWWVADTHGPGKYGRPGEERTAPQESQGEVGQANGKRVRLLAGGNSGLGDTNGTRHALGMGLRGNDGEAASQAAGKTAEQAGDIGGLDHATGEQVGRTGQPRQDSPWSDFDIIPCADGKARRVEPGSFPLAHGVSQRVGKLRAYGNSIVPQVAAEFIRAYSEVA